MIQCLSCLCLSFQAEPSCLKTDERMNEAGFCKTDQRMRLYQILPCLCLRLPLDHVNAAELFIST